VNEGLSVFASEMPCPVVCWMTPPELLPPSAAFASPVTF
jgi:hypothetical protein